MLSIEVRRLVETEIADKWSHTNAHGVDLKKCLVVPQKISCRNTFPALRGGHPLLLWSVLEELPSQKEGYLIVFDEETREFGLAYWEDNKPVFLGFYGGFFTTLDGM